MSKKSLILILVAISLFLIATTIKSGWLYLVSSTMISLVTLEAITGFRATRKLEIDRESPAEVFEGDSLMVRMKINNTGRTGKYYLSIRDLQFLPPKRELAKEIKSSPGKMIWVSKQGLERRKQKRGDAGGGFTRTIGVEKLGPHESVNVRYELEAARRGVYATSGVEISSAGIFETVNIRRSIQVPSDLIVYPKTYPLDSFPFHAADYASTVKPFESSRKGTGLDYFGIRDYTPGDSLRHIHWKSSARQGKLIVKEYQHDYQYSLGVLLLLNKPAFGDLINNSMEDGLRIAASIVRHLAMIGSAPWLVAYEGGSLSILQHSGPYELMKHLALYKPPAAGEDGYGCGLKESLGRLYGTVPVTGPLAVISNIQPGILARDLSGVTEMEGNSIILLPDESYGGTRAMKRIAEDLEGLKDIAFKKRVNLFQHESGKDIGECLKEPLNIIAA